MMYAAVSEAQRSELAGAASAREAGTHPPSKQCFRRRPRTIPPSSERDPEAQRASE